MVEKTKEIIRETAVPDFCGLVRFTTATEYLITTRRKYNNISSLK